MTRVSVPFIDANITDVTVTAWHKRPGDQVAAGEEIAELTTDKAAFALEAPAGGTLLAILAEVKSIVPVGYILALIGGPGERDPTAAADNAALIAACRARGAPPPPAPAAFPAAVPAAAPRRVRATPKARRLAEAHGLDLAAIQSRTGAAIVTEAVLAPFLPEGESS
jgi:pyruvate dehydrogenase E2 component (dihydrolipoamide acetyltransferase)